VRPALGAAAIVDFDGTLATLAIPWQTLRETLAVDRIEDLWNDPDTGRWAVVTRAEVEAAHVASPVPHVFEALAGVTELAVLSNNDESAIETFLERWPPLRERVRAVVGRRALGGPKTNFANFSEGYARCVAALTPADTPNVTYIGDMSYELDYARRWGACAYDVKELEAS
jgi:phosphoglycolate phosphatase-like HAD superfamily hydrolase